MPDCDWCGCWARDLRRLEGFEVCAACRRASLGLDETGTPDDESECMECGHRVARHAAVMAAPQQGPHDRQAFGHVGCVHPAEARRTAARAPTVEWPGRSDNGGVKSVGPADGG